MDPNLPATRPDAVPASPAQADEPLAPVAPRRPLSVAFLPLALVSFVVIAFVLAAWTFLSAAL